MLVLSRKCGERIVVSVGGEEVTIEILRSHGQQVRMGFQAAPHIAIHREEIWNNIVTEEKQPELMIA